MNDENEVTQEVTAVPKKAGRPKRAKIGEAKIGSGRVKYNERKQLEVDGLDPRYKYRWINTDNDHYVNRVDEAKKIGYVYANDVEIANSGIGSQSVGSANMKPVGKGTNAVLMKQLKEHYEEDQALKQLEVDRREDGMRREKPISGDDVYGEGVKIG